MALPVYLAMTGAEFENCSSFPTHMAWMACHFSPYATGLSNCPRTLPPGSMLILNDRTPIHSHDPALVAAQLRQTAEDLDVSAVLLDFQRPGCAAASEVAAAVSCAMPCPVGVSELYAGGLNTAVFINAPGLTQPLAEALAPWQGRELWLEAALSRAGWALTPEGCVPEAPPAAGEYPLSDPALHCRYRTEEAGSALHFYIERGPEMLEALLDEGEKLGVTRAVGLFQELGERLWP